ncbi:Protein kinase C conserved region 2 (CalB) [Balamuthia mandrillaris]
MSKILHGPATRDTTSGSMELSESTSMLLEIISAEPDNSVCADCGDPEVAWASHNLGVFLCIQCCGVHRGMGVRISKMKSIYLDQWKPEEIEFMRSMGNKKANEFWERNLLLQTSIMKPTPTSSQEAKEAYILKKYKDQAFVSSTGTDSVQAVASLNQTA